MTSFLRRAASSSHFVIRHFCESRLFIAPNFCARERMSKAATRIYCRVCTQPIQPGRIKCALCNTAVPESDLAAVGELILPKSPASASRMSTRASPNMSTKSASGFTSPATPVPHQLGKTDSNRASPKLDRSQQYAPAKAHGAPWQADMLQPLNVMGQHPDDMHGQPEVRARCKGRVMASRRLTASCCIAGNRSHSSWYITTM